MAIRLGKRIVRLSVILCIIGCFVYFSSSDLSYSKQLDTFIPSKESLINDLSGSRQITVKKEKEEEPEEIEQDVKIVNEEKKGKVNEDENEDKEAEPENKREEKKFSSIMPSMPDLEAKQELGRASWKYFHTLLARFPEEPNDEEREKLKTFVELYAQLYPCGECSHHFVKLIKKYPVQTSSRVSAAMWGCHVHNVVNEYLKKEKYDCSTILEDYDCGCESEKSKLEMNGVSVQKEDKQLGG